MPNTKDGFDRNLISHAIDPHLSLHLYVAKSRGASAAFFIERGNCVTTERRACGGAFSCVETGEESDLGLLASFDVIFVNFWEASRRLEHPAG